MIKSFQINTKYNDFNMEQESSKTGETQLSQDNEQKMKIQQEQFFEEILRSFKFLKKISWQQPFSVWLCMQKSTQTIQIIKILHKIDLTQNQIFHAKYHVIAIQTIQSIKTVKFNKIETKETFDFYIMEYCCRGDLWNFINDCHASTTFQLIRKIGFDVAIGLKDIHEQNFVYRDMKPENVVIDHQGNGKIIDFGLVVPVGLVDPYFCGTIQYMPPEHLLKSSLQKPILSSFDCWSFGIFLYQIFHKQLPYDSDEPQQLLDEIYEKAITFDPEFPQSGKKLIQNLLQTNPKKRLTMKQVLQHQFFQTDRENLNNRTPKFEQLLKQIPCSCQDIKNMIENQ